MFYPKILLYDCVTPLTTPLPRMQPALHITYYCSQSYFMPALFFFYNVPLECF